VPGDKWTSTILELTGKRCGNAVDVIIGSEDYVKVLGDAMGIDHVIFQKDRGMVDISATQIRADIDAHWDYLTKYSKYVIRKDIHIIGGESTGKSTLCEAICQDKKKFTLVPEFAKSLGTNISEKDFIKIAWGQRASYDCALGYGRRISVHDTNLIVTLAWFDKLFPEGDMEIRSMISEFIESMNYNKIYLLDNSVEWEQDGTRFFEDDIDRLWFFTHIQTILEDFGFAYTVIKEADLDKRVDFILNDISEWG